MEAKIYVFEGPESSGKTRLAKEIADSMGYPMAVYLNARSKRFLQDSFFFRSCKDCTKLIVLDDLFPINIKVFSILKILNLKNGVYVNQVGSLQFKINPDIIITTTNIGLFENYPDVHVFKFPLSYLHAANIKEFILSKAKEDQPCTKSN